MTIFMGPDAKLDCNNIPTFVVSIVQISRTFDYFYILTLTNSKTNKWCKAKTLDLGLEELNLSTGVSAQQLCDLTQVISLLSFNLSYEILQEFSKVTMTNRVDNVCALFQYLAHTKNTSKHTYTAFFPNLVKKKARYSSFREKSKL